MRNLGLLDFMPIMTCYGKRTGKVAREITNKGYCSAKSVYYYGMKMHLLGFRCIGRLPHPEQILFTPATLSDTSAYKKAWSELKGKVFLCAKIYSDIDFNDEMMKNHNSEMLNPIKEVKGMPDEIKKRIKAADDLFSTAVSLIRQPIEALFNWIIEKADIQKASKVRSTKGLLIHAFGRLAAAYITLAI